MDKKIGVPKRKKNRLENYDYSSCGAYFLTVCTSEKRNYLGKIVGAISDRPPKAEDLANALGDHYIYDTPQIELSEYGRIVEQAILQIPSAYPALSVDCYTIMPNHIHLLLIVHCDECGRSLIAPTVSRVIRHMKSYVSKQIGVSIWQKSFHDHVIRNREDYEKHVKYIYENPMRWYYDELYSDE
ncbi:MAG: transposase [Ruminococcaceae bacterium]|nr:transposase [Oscillospiraceae bacterium]